MTATRARWLAVASIAALATIGGCTALAGLGGYEKGDCVGAACEPTDDAPASDARGDGAETTADSTLDTADAGRDSTVDTRPDTTDSTIDTADTAAVDSTIDTMVDTMVDTLVDSSDAGPDVDETIAIDDTLDGAVDDTAPPPDTSLGDTGTPLDSDAFVGCEASAPLDDAATASCPPDMIAFPGGSYPSPHATSGTFVVNPFCLDRFEVTGAQFQQVWETCGGDSAPLIADCGFPTYGDPSRPINCVNGMEAEFQYCNRVGKRLPTEEEWEFAERNAPSGGSAGSQLPWGANAIDAGDDVHLCWALTNPLDGGPCAIHRFPAGDGVYPGAIVDLAGNVEEWTASFVTGTVSDYYVRGGSFSTSDRNYPTADYGRFGYASTDRSSDRGFRCARTRSP